MSPKKSKFIIPVLSVVTFVGFLDTHLLIPIMSLYLTDMGIGLEIVGLIIGVYSIVNTPANIGFGRVVDRWGFKLPLVIGLLGDAVSMFLYTISRRPVHFFLVRIMHGLSGGMVGPATMSAIAEQTSAGNRGHIMAFYGMAIASATLVGYGSSAMMSSRLGYNAVFVLGGGLLVVGSMLALLLRDSRPLPVVQKTVSGDSIWRKLFSILRRRELAGPYAVIFAQYFSFGGVVTVLPVHIKQYGMESFHVGMMLAVFAVLFIIVQLPVGNMADRTGRRFLSLGGIALGVVALALMPFLDSFARLAACMALYGTAYGMIFPSVTAMLTDVTSGDERGLATGLFHALLTAGVAIGAPVMGWVASLTGESIGLGISGVALFIAFIIMWWSSRKKPVA